MVGDPQTGDLGGWDPYSPRGSGTGHTGGRGYLWGVCAQGWSSWASALCAHGPPSGPWALYCAYDSGHTQVKHHYGKAYPSPSHLDKDPYDGFAGGERLLDEVGSLRRGGTGGPFLLGN